MTQRPKPRVVQSEPLIQLFFTVGEVTRMYEVATKAAKRDNDWTVANLLMEANDVAKNELAKDRVGG